MIVLVDMRFEWKFKWLIGIVGAWSSVEVEGGWRVR